MTLLEIFYAGRHPDRNGVIRDFSTDDVNQIAETYDYKRHEAPIVINHDESQPNQGLIKAVIAMGGRLFAIPHKVAAEFAEGVNSGRYPKISVGLYAPSDIANPVPGKWGLRHVSFVQIPALKGMDSPTFAENPNIWFSEGINFSGISENYTAMLFRNLREWLIGDGKQELADKVLPDYAISALQVEAIAEQMEDQDEGEQPQNIPSYTEKPVTNKTEDKASVELLAENLRLKAQLTQRDNAEFCEGLIKDGKLQPALKTQAIQLLGSIPATKIEFGEGDSKTEKPAIEAFKDFLKALPKAIEYKELPADEAKLPTDPVELAALIEAKYREEHAKGNVISFSEAQALLEAGK